MFVSMAVSVLLLLLSPSAGGREPPDRGASDECMYDRSEMLALDELAFDQDLDGGWRALAGRPGCMSTAADLIRDYRRHNQTESSILYWHEGQLRAMTGETEEAIELFEMSRMPESVDYQTGWNYYVDATIAFLRQDREALERAREELAAIPEPPEWNPRDANGNPVDIEWPPNLNVVDSLIACFGREYSEAYEHCQK